MVQDAPASLNKADVVPWAVAAKGYTGQKATFATAAGEAAYDWMAARAGQLNPFQRDEQQKACADYVKMLAESGEGAVGAAAKMVGPEPVGDGPPPEDESKDFAQPPMIDGKPVVGLGFILGWILASLIWNLVSYLFWHMVDEPKRLQAFRAMHDPK